MSGPPLPELAPVVVPLPPPPPPELAEEDDAVVEPLVSVTHMPLDGGVAGGLHPRPPDVVSVLAVWVVFVLVVAVDDAVLVAPEALLVEPDTVAPSPPSPPAPPLALSPQAHAVMLANTQVAASHPPWRRTTLRREKLKEDWSDMGASLPPRRAGVTHTGRALKCL